MTWGGDGWQDIPNATTWNGWATGREWESAGTGLDLWSGGPTFNIYRSSVSSGWTDITSGVNLLDFNSQRSVAAWYRGMRAGSATITVDYTDGDGSALDINFWRGRRIKISADVPAGEKDLFAGFVINRTKAFDARGYPVMHVHLVDAIGFSGQCTVSAATGGNAQTGDLIRGILPNAAGYKASDIANLTASVGVSQTGTYPAGNMLDLLNQYLRGELGMMWVDGSGDWAYAMRDWWYPQGDPVATIGSLDRGGSRDDPAEGDTGYKFPATHTRFDGTIGYTYFTWNYPTSSASVGSTATNFGTRVYNDDVLVVGATDVTQGIGHIAVVLFNDPTFGYTYDMGGTVRFSVEDSAETLDYAATAEITDFVEVAKETFLEYDRSWHPAFVTGVRHEWNPSQGWYCTLQLELGLAEWDQEAADS